MNPSIPKKVVLIDPPGFFGGLNTGLAYLAGALRANGTAQVQVLDFNNDSSEVRKRLEAAVHDADIVGVSVKTFTAPAGADLLRQAREINPSILTVAGGPHITLDGPGFMGSYPECAIGVMLEGEESFTDLVAGKPVAEIPGLLYREGGKIISTGARKPNPAIDALALPDYQVFDSLADGKIPAYPLLTSRGCPYPCTYCSVGKVSGLKWRGRCGETILAELEQARRLYGTTEFKVVDDNFTYDMERAAEICRLFINRRAGFKWSCPNGVRADRLTPELLALMKEAGCHTISLGIESLVPEVFAQIKKGEPLEKVIAAVHMIKKAGMRVEGFFIIGLPGSTYETDMTTLREARRLKLDAYAWSMLVPYPGTKIWEWVKSNDGKGLRVLKDWREGLHIGMIRTPVFETQEYPARLRVRAYHRAYLGTLTPGDILRIVKTLVRVAWQKVSAKRIFQLR